MRDGPEHVEYEFASGRCRVDPLLKADQVDLSGLEIIDGFQQLLERAPQTIKADNGECVVGVVSRKWWKFPIGARRVV